MLARFILKGIQGIALEKFAKSLAQHYEAVKYDKPKVAMQAENYQIQGPNRKYSLNETPSKSLEDHIRPYINRVLDNTRQYLDQLRKVTEDLRKIGTYQQVDYAQLNAKLGKAYELMSGLIGYKKKKGMYSSDYPDYMDEISDMNENLDRILQKASRMDIDNRNFLARNTAKIVLIGIGHKTGIPLERIARGVSDAAYPFTEIQKEAKVRFKDYSDAVKKLRSSYSDFSVGVYEKAS